LHNSCFVWAFQNVALCGKIYMIKLLLIQGLDNFLKSISEFCSVVLWTQLETLRKELKGNEIEYAVAWRNLDLCLAESHEDLFSTTARRHVWWTSESWFSSDRCYGNHTRKPQRQQSCDPIFALALPSSFCNATRVRMLFYKKAKRAGTPLL